jgi:hypothetical protein
MKAMDYLPHHGDRMEIPKHTLLLHNQNRICILKLFCGTVMKYLKKFITRNIKCKSKSTLGKEYIC